MHQLYVDDVWFRCRSIAKFFVLTGVSVIERKTHFVEQKLNAVAELFSPSSPYDVELHGSPKCSQAVFSKNEHVTSHSSC